jgi:hypothetical protein
MIVAACASCACHATSSATTPAPHAYATMPPARGRGRSRRARERDERRQCEPEQQQQARRQRLQRRHPRRWRKRFDECARQHCGEQLLSDQRAGHAGHARDGAERRELDDEQRERARHGGAEAAEHRGRIQMAAKIARCGERDGDRREQHGDERSEPQEPLGALERLPYLGPQIAHGFDALARLQFAGEPRLELRDVACAPLGDQKPPRRAIARLQQIRRGHIVEVQQ